MKILHTADWHLGHRLHEHHQQEEQQQFLDWLLALIDKEKIDVLLISGDVYDTGVPSTQSQKMYYDFLIALQQTHCSEAVITGGNHDAPGTINAPKELLSALSVHVVGKATEEVKDEVFQLKVREESLVVAAVPYLRDQDIRRAIKGESFDEITERYKKALVNHYDEVAAYCQAIPNENGPTIAMGHLFAVGGSISDSEQQIYVGNLGHIGADDFPETFDYIALGHLHKPQIVGGNEKIRYSGSPVMLSFSEAGSDKQVLILETAEKSIDQIQSVEVPVFRQLIRLKGSQEECIGKIQNLELAPDQLTPWVEVTIKSSQHTTINQELFHQEAEKRGVEVLKVTTDKSRNLPGLEQRLENTATVKDLSPMEVFKQKCSEEEFSLQEHPEVEDAFEEALNIARAQ
ncbi:MAG: exonuclease SbcCD subunit D C-terminal domain-containing protein [Bacteroidota bacterium]